MRLLITGGAGFIGSNLARLALSEGFQVRVIDNLSTGDKSSLEGLDVEFACASILQTETLEDVMAGVDSIIHLAALPSVARSIRDPMASHLANATGTLNVLERARSVGVSHVVVASSSSVYGANPELPKHERAWIRPMSPYAVSKLAAEQYALSYQQSFGMDTLAFRFFNVYGPGQPAGHGYAAVIPAFIDAHLSGRPLPLQGDGAQSRDFTYVETVCRVITDAVQRRVWYAEPVNLAFGTNTKLLDLIALLEVLTGRRASIEQLDPRAGDVRASQADNRTLRMLFPSVMPVDLEDGLLETVAWLESRR